MSLAKSSNRQLPRLLEINTAVAALLLFVVPVNARSPVDEVDPSIGGQGFLLEPIRPTVHNGKTFSIVCKDNSQSNKYIQSIRLNGEVLNRVWFKHSELVIGGRIELQMGDTPNVKLGADPSALPPSSVDVNSAAFR